MPQLVIRTFCLGDWMTNCYVVHGQGGRECWVVDAGFDPQSMIEYISEQGLEPIEAIQTHAHVDHIAGLNDLRVRWPTLGILIHPAEREFLTDTSLNLSVAAGMPIVAPRATGSIEHGEMIDLDGEVFEVRHTPGHSPGGICLYNADNCIAIVGDTLFAGSIGRTDFPTSSQEQLFESIKKQLLALPDDTRVLPGHGPETTIGDERTSNPFL